MAKMLAVRSLALFIFMSFTMLISAHPVVVDITTREPSPNPHQLPQQQPLGHNLTRGKYSLQDLFDGNTKSRQGIRLEAKTLAEEAPSFMFIGCLDSRLTPSDIFNTHPGSILLHNNLANQYSPSDSSAETAVAYAIESLQVQHIIILGHYGCKGVETAITRSTTVSRVVRKWMKSVSDLYATSRRREIVVLRDSRKPRRGQDEGVQTAPPASDPGFRALVEENVKRGVKQLRKHSSIKDAYNGNGNDMNIFVHGFVYDEVSGEVHDLNVSFGPPGKPIPHVPFNALEAARNYHRDSDKPHISKGKSWDFSSYLNV